MSKVTALQVMRIALQQYHVVESPAGSNNVKYNTAYYGHAVRGDKYAWCAVLVWWVGWIAAGKDQSLNPFYKNANAADIQILTVKNKNGKYILKQTSNNTKKKNALPKYKLGDNISFNFNGGTSRQHTGLVVGVWENYIYCLEGNTSFDENGSQSNGGAVALRKRYYTTGVCVVRPDYAPFVYFKPSTPYEGKTVKLPARGWFRYGDNNAKVVALQQALRWANGYGLVDDGDFGGKTFAEVVIFQLANGLEPDGQFGENCLDKLNELIAKNRPKNDDLTDETPTVDTNINKENFVPTQGDLCYDLSDHQGKLSVEYFEDIKKKGVKSVILRATYTKLASPFRLRVDAHFHHNIKNAIKAGMHIGTYHFSQAISKSEGKEEASFHLKEIEPYIEHIDLPVGFDCEFGKYKGDDGKWHNSRFNASVAKKKGKTGMQDIIDGFCDPIKKARYEPMLYANLTMFNNYLPASIYKKLKIWIAQYNKTCDYKHPYFMWQFTSNNGKLDENKFGTQDTNVKKKTKGQRIAAEAKECSYPKGTSKKVCGYPDGKPKPEYKKALNEAYPDRSKWGKQTRAGASCDVAVGTFIRASGVDKKFPRGLDEVESYMKKNKDKWEKTGVTSKAKMKKGDVIYELYKGGGGHISVFINENTIANAHYNGKTYPILESYDKQIKGKSKCKKFIVYRAKE